MAGTNRQKNPKVIVQVTSNMLIQRLIQNPVKYVRQNIFEKIIVAVGNFSKDSLRCLTDYLLRQIILYVLETNNF